MRRSRKQKHQGAVQKRGKLKRHLVPSPGIPKSTPADWKLTRFRRSSTPPSRALSLWRSVSAPAFSRSFSKSHAGQNICPWEKQTTSAAEERRNSCHPREASVFQTDCGEQPSAAPEGTHLRPWETIWSSEPQVEFNSQVTEDVWRFRLFHGSNCVACLAQGVRECPWNEVSGPLYSLDAFRNTCVEYRIVVYARLILQWVKSQ